MPHCGYVQKELPQTKDSEINVSGYVFNALRHMLALATHLRLEIVLGVVLSGHPDFRDLHQHNEFSEKLSVTIPDCCVGEGQASPNPSCSDATPVGATQSLTAVSG